MKILVVLVFLFSLIPASYAQRVTPGRFITDVYDCRTGNCEKITMSDGDLLDMSGVNPNTVEGLILPQAASCTEPTEGLVCWDHDNDELHIGTSSGTVSIGTGAGSGDITKMFDCTTGDCTDVTVSDGDSLDFSAVNPSVAGEGLIFPQAASCTAAVTEGQACWDTTSSQLIVGDGVSAVVIGASGDIQAIYNCLTGDCSSISLSDGDGLDMTAVNPNVAGEGLVLPQTTVCGPIDEGQVCWDTDNDRLTVGDGTTTRTLVSDVMGCAGGDCSTITGGSGDFLNLSAIDPGTGEGFRLPQGLACTTDTDEGGVCWDTDDDVLAVGTGAGTVRLGITAIFDCLKGNCTNLIVNPGEGINLSAVAPTNDNDGIVLPQGADCSGSEQEGQICWDTNDDKLFIGDSSGVVEIGSQGDIESVFNCLSGPCTNLNMVEGEGIDMSAIQPTAAGEGLILPQETDCTNTQEGQVCWDTNDDELNVGTGAGTVTIGVGAGAGDITRVFECTTGDCMDINVADGDSLDFSSVTPNDTGEGLILPQTADCSVAVNEGQTCWDIDGDQLFVGNGSAAVLVSDSNITVDGAFDNGKQIDGANSAANAFCVGTGANDQFCWFIGTGGPERTCTAAGDDCDNVQEVPAGKDFILSLAGVDQLTISSTGVVALGEALEETKELMIPAGFVGVDGTQCSKDNQTLNAENFNTVTCLDDNAATISFGFPAPAAWDEAEIRIEAIFFQNDGTPDGNIEFDWTSYCAGHNDPFGHGNYETEIAAGTMLFDASAVAQNDLIYASTSGDIPVGTCTEKDMIRIRGQVDAGNTTAVSPDDVHLLWLVVKIAFNTWSK